MHGTFAGKDYRVVGRSVMGATERGEVYYWNEYHLETTAGEHAILVYDESERDAAWRMFAQFSPEYPISAAEAATKFPGDPLNLTGEDVRVTYRGTSRLYHVEGQTPKGDPVGTLEEYFNATAESIMQVVSWAGDKVEFYNGLTLTPNMVATAFGLPVASVQPAKRMFSSFSSSEDSDEDSRSYLSGFKFAVIALIALVVLIASFGRGCFFGGREAAPVTKLVIGAPPLNVGASCTIQGTPYHATSHALVEMAEVGTKWQQHEYTFTNDAGDTALLVCQGKEWVWYQLLSLANRITPQQAAAKKVGDPVLVEGFTGRVSELFQMTVEQADGQGRLLPTGTIRYGLAGTDGTRLLLVRWDQSGIDFFRGQKVDAKTVTAGSAAGN